MNDVSSIRELIIAMYCKDKLSYIEMGKALGVSKNVVAGHIHRAREMGMDLPSRESAIRVAAMHKRIEARKGQPRKSPTKRVLPPTPEAPPATPPSAYDGPTGALAILGLKTVGSCCWPLGDPKEPNFRYCCEPCFDTYCVKHTALAHIPRNQPKKRDSRACFRILVPAFR